MHTYHSNLLLSLSLVLALSSPSASGQEGQYVKSTEAYKTVGDLAILADVYRPTGERVVPVVVWIHGGALINGHREGISGRVRDYAKSRGFALVSIDYRLAPETKLPAILEDIEDAFRWIRGPAAKKFHLDPKRIAVTGGSAGGYLTLVTGYRVKPRPQALVAFWGYGDLIGPWYSSPSKHPRHNRVKPTREEAWKQVSGSPVADSRKRKGNGGLFYVYCRQTGLWPQHVSDWDPHSESEKFFPYMPVKNVTADWPPTLMIHGTEDTDVPHEQSAMMARQFVQHGVDHNLISIEKGEHGLGGGDPIKINQAYREADKFLDQILVQD
jgi:acetyl esterase/lipase